MVNLPCNLSKELFLQNRILFDLVSLEKSMGFCQDLQNQRKVDMDRKRRDRWRLS